MLYGIVDIGSNTIRLKIYEYKNNKIKSVFSKKKTAGLIAYRDDGKLNDEGINILSSILNKAVFPHVAPEQDDTISPLFIKK